MNKKLSIAAIALVAIAMGLSAMTPAMAQEKPGEGGEHDICRTLQDKLENAGVRQEQIKEIFERICSNEPAPEA